MKKTVFVVIIITAIVAGCSTISPDTGNITIHTKIPRNNTIYFNGGFGIEYNWHGRKYLALFNGSEPFVHAYTPADLTFVRGVLVKMSMGNKTYVPYKVSVEIPNSSGGFSNWKVLYLHGKFVYNTKKKEN